MPDDPHAVAILDRLRGDTSLTVYDGEAPEDPTESLPDVYVVVYFSGLPKVGDDLTMGSTERLVRIYTHSVGGDAESMRAVAGKVEARLLDFIPTVSGRVCWPIRHESSVPPQRNESTGLLVQSQADTWVLKSKTV